MPPNPSPCQAWVRLSYFKCHCQQGKMANGRREFRASASPEHALAAPRLEGRDVVRRADRDARRAVRDALDQAAEHLAGADLVERRDPLPGHEAYALAPAPLGGDVRCTRAHELARASD